MIRKTEDHKDYMAEIMVNQREALAVTHSLTDMVYLVGIEQNAINVM